MNENGVFIETIGVGFIAFDPDTDTDPDGCGFSELWR